MDVLFDHNVVDHLEKRHEISNEEFVQLRAKAKAGTIKLKLSFLNIDEILAGLLNHRDLALAQLRLVADLIGLDTMIKPPDQLLTHHLVDVAFDLPLRESEIQVPLAMRDHLRRLLDADAEEI